MSENNSYSKKQKKLIRQMKKQFGFKCAARQFDQRRLSPFGGYIDVLNFSHALRIKETISKRFNPAKSTHRFYSDADILQRLLDLTILGIDRIENADLLYNDTLLRQLRDLNCDPSPSTLRRELENCYAKDITDLEEINTDLLENQSNFSTSPQEVTLLIDLTPINSYGQQQRARAGFNHRKTKKCFQALIATIQETQDIIKIDLKPGNFLPSAQKMKKFMSECLSLIPSHLKVVKVRLDSGFWSFPLLNFLEENNLEYFVKGTLKNNTPLTSLPSRIPEKNWTRVPQTTIWVSCKMQYYSSKYKKSYPLIFIREKTKKSDNKQLEIELGPNYSYRPLFSNSFKTPLKIYKTYNKGALVEDVIKEVKNEFFLDKISSHKFKANYAFLKIKVIAYNILNAFKRLIIKGRWATRSARTIRNWLIKIPCLISSHGKGMKLIYADNLKLKSFLNSISTSVWNFSIQALE